MESVHWVQEDGGGRTKAPNMQTMREEEGTNDQTNQPNQIKMRAAPHTHATTPPHPYPIQ